MALQIYRKNITVESVIIFPEDLSRWLPIVIFPDDFVNDMA